MSRKRWIYPKGGDPIEVSQDYVQPRDATSADSVLWNDRSYQDMCDPRFQSRSEHRRYMAQNDLTTIDDFTETWNKAAKERERALRGIDPSRKEDLLKAINQRRR